jgi:hypothetical protein
MDSAGLVVEVGVPFAKPKTLRTDLGVEDGPACGVRIADTDTTEDGREIVAPLVALVEGGGFFFESLDGGREGDCGLETWVAFFTRILSGGVAGVRLLVFKLTLSAARLGRGLIGRDPRLSSAESPSLLSRMLSSEVLSRRRTDGRAGEALWVESTTTERGRYLGRPEEPVVPDPAVRGRSPFALALSSTGLSEEGADTSEGACRIDVDGDADEPSVDVDAVATIF